MLIVNVLFSKNFIQLIPSWKMKYWKAKKEKENSTNIKVWEVKHTHKHTPRNRQTDSDIKSLQAKMLEIKYIFCLD